MKRIEEYEKEIQSAASEHFNRHSGSGVMYLCGKSGMGKTLLARQFVKDATLKRSRRKTRTVKCARTIF